MKLFVDTWGWLALRDRKESGHQRVKELSVNNIMSGDEHFEHVGMGFEKKP